MNPSDTAAVLAKLRNEAPLVHNITNFVAMDITANVLLAAGASPAMAHAPEEVEEMVGIASALVINIGTLSLDWVSAMTTAANRARLLEKPWVLDPVGAGATTYRTKVARELIRLRPTVIRANASEVLALNGGPANRTKGVDSVHTSNQAASAAVELAREIGCVVAVTGAVDYVTDGRTVVGVHHGDPMMARVTALGCAATALVGAFLAVNPDALRATAQALAVLGLSGEIAARSSPGPGSLRWRLLDAIYSLDKKSLAGARFSREAAD